MTDSTTAGRDTPEQPSARLAAEIRRLRRAAQMSQPELAQRIGYTRQYVSMAERVGKNLPSQELVRALDTALDAAGSLLALRAQAKIEQRARRSSSRFDAGLPISDWVRSKSERNIDTDHHVSIEAPAGRFFAGSTILAKSYPCVDDGRITVAIPEGFAEDPFLMRPCRKLIIGTTSGADKPRHFGIDGRRARARLADAADEAPLLIPRAYELDHLTLGILWAVANLDDALLDDDAELVARSDHLSTYESKQKSAVGRELGAELTPVSQMWLGSSFCAGHILRHSDALSDTPAFWTREQRGEEASAWLLFGHKHEYLRKSAMKFETGAARSTRSFCVPRSAVVGSAPSERVMLFLAVALMESFAIRVDICVEPEYTAVQGFVLNQRRSAIVANWVGTDAIWQVDVTDSRPTLREFADASGYARAHSIIAAPTSDQRLHALADYLDLDWSWLVRRCAELGDYGCAGLAQPRSRLLSVTGLDQACRYVGEVSRPDR